MKLLFKMRTIKDLSATERYVVNYILSNPNEVGNIGIVELAQKSASSTSTIKRLCSKLGFESYIDFRLQLSVELQDYLKESILEEAGIPIQRSDSVAAIIKKVSYFNARSIIDSREMNPPKIYEKIVEEMNQSQRIDFYGVGPSNLVAKDAALKCLRLGINTTAYNSHLEMMINAKSSDTTAMAFMISYTGETEEILDIAEELLKRDITIVSVTGLSDNKLSKLAKYRIYVDASEPDDRLGAMYSRTSTLNVVDILFTALINTNYDKYMNKAMETYVAKKREPLK